MKELNLKDMEALIDDGWKQAVIDSEGLHKSNIASPEVTVGKMMWEQYKVSINYFMSELRRMFPNVDSEDVKHD